MKNFLTYIDRKETVDTMIKKFDGILESYAKKRRGEEEETSFDTLEVQFKESLAELIESNSVTFDLPSLPPFSKELFDKHTDATSGKIEIKESEKRFGNFVYQHQWWKLKGSRIMEDRILATTLGFDFFLDKDILDKDFKECVVFTKPPKGWRSVLHESTDYVPPRADESNMTQLPAWIKSIDYGKICIKENTDLEKVFEFSGGSLTGLYKATRENKNQDFWKLIKEARHRRDHCMECTTTPKYEVKWAEGHGHAWFCESHFKTWSGEHKSDIDYIKEVKDGVAAVKFADNTNPNIKETILK